MGTHSISLIAMVQTLMAFSTIAALGSVSAECGEAAGKDVSHNSANVKACQACKGADACLVYDAGMLDNIGMTACFEHGHYGCTDLDTPPECGEAYAEDVSQNAENLK